jgi:hypothetical protein
VLPALEPVADVYFISVVSVHINERVPQLYNIPISDIFIGE